MVTSYAVPDPPPTCARYQRKAMVDGIEVLAIKESSV